MRTRITTVSTYLEAVKEFSEKRNRILSMENQLITRVMTFAKEYFEYRKNDPEFLKEMRMHDYSALTDVEQEEGIKDLALLDKIITNYTLELGKITPDWIVMRVVERDNRPSDSWWTWSFPVDFLYNTEWKKVLSGEIVEEAVADDVVEQVVDTEDEEDAVEDEPETIEHLLIVKDTNTITGAKDETATNQEWTFISLESYKEMVGEIK